MLNKRGYIAAGCAAFVDNKSGVFLADLRPTY